MHMPAFADLMDFATSLCTVLYNYWLQGHCSMGGACSRKRDPQVNEDSLQRGVSGKYCRIGSSKWLGTSISRPALDILQGRGQCPSLMELCIYKIREVS